MSQANSAWIARSRAAVWHPCTQMKMHETVPMIPVVRAEGVWLYDAQGRPYLDAVSSWWVNLLGHNHPRLKAALREQLNTVEHVMLAGCTHEAVVLLSEKLAAITPGELGHCFYGADGASATEIALKMSMHYWRNTGRPGKNRFLALANGYHGETIGALSVTDVALFRDAYAPLLRANDTVPAPDARLAEAGESAEAFAERCAGILERHLEAHHAELAAFIIEPLVQGAAGMVMYHPHYLARARELCSRYGVHLICDEIAVGFGRTGTLFASEQADVAPDFLCLSKGLTGGYLPLSVVLTTDEVFAAFYDDDAARAFLHSHSYTGNALACRAALATIEALEAGRVIAANRDKAQMMTALFAPLAGHPKVRHFRSTGMIWAMDVVTQRPDFANWCFARALEVGLLLRPIGRTLYFMPPYAIDQAAAQHLAQGALRLLDEA